MEKKLWLERALVLGISIFLLWLPLPEASVPTWAASITLFFVAILTLLWAVWVLGREAYFPKGLLRTALLMFCLLLLVQLWLCVQYFLYTNDGSRTFFYALLGVGYSSVFLQVVTLFTTRKRLSFLVGVLVVSGTFQAFWGAAMTLSGVNWLFFEPKVFGLSDATGTFVNRNHLAGYLEMTLACGVGLLLALRDGRSFHWRNIIELVLGPKAKLRLALVIMVIALVMTHSRMGNTAFFAALMLIGGIFVLRDKDNRLRNGLILASVVLLDVLIVSQYFGLERLKDRVLDTQLHDVVVAGEVVQQANEIRPEVFSAAIPLAQERLLVGQGAGSFEVVFPQYVTEKIKLHFDHAHNDYLQFIIEFGLIGFLPLVAFVLVALYCALSALWDQRSLYRSGLGVGVSIGIVSILIHSTTDFNLQIPANALTFVVLCAIGVLAKYHTSSRRKTV